MNSASANASAVATSAVSVSSDPPSTPGLRYHWELLGHYGYDFLSHLFHDETKPVREFLSLKVGDAAERTIAITKWRIFFFALVSGDWNRLHFDSRFAAQTRFGSPIGHGLILGGVVSALLGTELPGRGTYYISQAWKFRGPTKIGDDAVVRVTITSIDSEKRRAVLLTEARVEGVLVASGEAVVGLDEFPYEK